MVKRGANKRKFLVMKKDMSKDELLKAISCEPDVMDKVDGIIKEFNGTPKVAPKAHEEKDVELPTINQGAPDEDESGFNEEFEKMMKAELTTEGRKHIKDTNFALPEERKYPINDAVHARNALARVSQHGTPEEKAKVKAAVHRKYPNMGKVDKADGYISQDQDEQQGPLDEKAQSALKAIVRILTPFKQALSPLLIHEVLDAAGFQMAANKGSDEEDMDMKKTATQSPEPIKEEHQIEAMKVAKEAYGAHLKKLGYQKYPTQQMAQKELTMPVAGHKDDDDVEAEEQEGTMHNPDKEPDMTVQHKHEHVMKSLLAGVPKGTRDAVEMIFKANQDLKMRLEAVTKAASRKEFMEQAASYDKLGLGNEEVADLFQELSEKSPKALETVQKAFSAANEQVKKGNLFSEYGSVQSGSIGNTWEGIVKAAQGMVVKSGEKVSDAVAIDRFIQTPEGKKMYTEYDNELRAAARRA
jgi:hypothetical protein